MGEFLLTFAELVLDAFKDSIILIPFLFLSYLLMEWLEHRYSKKTQDAVSNAGYAGPLIGGLLGIFPQCGIPAAAATFYSGRVITLGTLFAVFLCCSDEMLPIMIAKHATPNLVFIILGIKLVIGVLMGFLIDSCLRMCKKFSDKVRIRELCDRSKCNCHSTEASILKSTLFHTVQITIFIFVITLALNIMIEIIDKESLINFMTINQELSILVSGIIGLIPNCAASVLITDLYLEGVLSFGAMMSGLFVGAGIGMLVLFRTNRPILFNFLVVFMLLLSGVFWGLVLNFLNLQF